MKTYKGLNKNLKNRADMYEIVEEYDEECTALCSSFPVCGSSTAILGNYTPSDNISDSVEISDPFNQRSLDSKMCGKRIKIGAEIGIKGLVTAQFEFLKEQCGSNDDVKRGSVLTGGSWSNFRGEMGSHYRGGMWSVFAETLYDDNWKVIGVATAVVDGEKIKPDVWYKVVNGEFVEVNDTVKQLPECGITAKETPVLCTENSHADDKTIYD